MNGRSGSEDNNCRILFEKFDHEWEQREGVCWKPFIIEAFWESG